jgi:hypothetical protein
MRARITAFASIADDDAASFDARSALPERKHIKLMSRAVQLGVAAALGVLARRPGWQELPPERRGLFVGARPEGAMDALADALRATSRDGPVDADRFGRLGYPLVPPLWLVAGLSNNIVGYASAYADLRGPVSNRCEGRVGGLAAIVEACRAIAEGRVDLAVAGGADDRAALPIPPGWPGICGAEGAAFVVIERAGRGWPVTAAGVAGRWAGDEPPPGVDRGAAEGALRLVEALRADRPGRVEVGDPLVGSAWIEIDRRDG